MTEIVTLHRTTWGDNDTLVGLFTTEEKAAAYIAEHCPEKCKKRHDRLWSYGEIPGSHSTNPNYAKDYQVWADKMCSHTWDYEADVMEVDPT